MSPAGDSERAAATASFSFMLHPAHQYGPAQVLALLLEVLLMPLPNSRQNLGRHVRLIVVVAVVTRDFNFRALGCWFTSPPTIA